MASLHSGTATARRWRRLAPLLALAIALVGGITVTLTWPDDERGRPSGAPDASASAEPQGLHSAAQALGTGPTASGSAPGATPARRRPGAGIWRPGPATRWQWQIVDKVSTPFRSVPMYDVDLTEAVPRATTRTIPGFGSVHWPKGPNAGIIDRLHAAGKIAICYLDTGAWESYEPDAGLFPGKPGWSDSDPADDVIGDSSGWENEYWLDIRPAKRSRFAPIVWARLDLAKSIGCDGVEPDQNNPYGNNPGAPISLADEKSWYLEVARQAHARGLSVGMKNGVEVTDADTVAAFDWNLNEQCFYYNECDVLSRFIKAGKAVFQVEYTDDWASRGYGDPAALARSSVVCPGARSRSFATLIKKEVPDGSFVTC